MFDIVDAQIHLGPSPLEPTLAAMDALGIKAALIDEFWGGFAPGDPGNAQPGYLMRNGAWRTASPIAELACLLHPDRFSYFVRVDRRDPDLESLLRLVKSSPHLRAIRLMPVRTQSEAEAFSAGAYNELFAMAQDLDIPVFLYVPGQAERAAGYLEAFPKLSFIIDHCGVTFSAPTPGRPEPRSPEAQFEETLKLAVYDNVALKWAHAQRRLLPDGTTYPHAPLRPLLRRAIDAFGAQRVMWASDHTVMPGHSWADILLFIRENPDLTDLEKTWILGRSLCTILKWDVD